MKLSVTQENLSKALSTVGRIVSTRSSLPVLGNVLLATDANRLKLSATNLEIGINYWVGSKVDQEGSVTVPARLLTEFVTSLPAGNIELSASEANLTIKTPHFDSMVNGISAEEFPLIPEVKSEPVITISSAVFREAAARVVVAASLDENRPVFAGVYMHTEDDNLVIVATDTYRLAEHRLPLPNAPKESISMIVPARTIQEVVRILADLDGDVEIYLTENQVMFRAGSVEVVSRLIEGTFPNYKQIIPDKEETSATLPTAEFTRITKIASLFARENAGSVRISIQAEGEISVISSAAQIGENNSTAECDVAGDDGEIALNARYLLDALSVVKAKQMRFAISGKLNPCVITAEGDELGEYLHIIMPLRT